MNDYVTEKNTTLGIKAQLHHQLDSLEYGIAESDVAKEAVYQLRYRRYRDDGLIGVQAQKLIYDRYDDLPNGRIFTLHQNNKLVSSFRIHLSKPENRDTPSISVFEDVLAPMIDKHQSMIDPTRFVVDDIASRKIPDLMSFTVRLAPMAAIYHKVDIGLASVQARHRAYYKRSFGFSLLCEPRPYEGLARSVCLMSGTIADIQDRYFNRYPHMNMRQGEGDRLFGDGTENVVTLGFNKRLEDNIPSNASA